MNDALPAGAAAGAAGGDGWNWVSSSPAPLSGSVSHISNDANWSNWSPAPYSGNVSHQSAISSGVHQHYFYASPTNIPVRAGGKLYAHIYIDPENIPQEVMLQWGTPTDGWEHRAYWGANALGWGADGTSSRRYMGPLPQAGGWVRLEVPASAVGLEGLNVNAIAFSLYGGRANWDLAGVEGMNVWVEENCYLVCPLNPEWNVIGIVLIRRTRFMRIMSLWTMPFPRERFQEPMEAIVGIGEELTMLSCYTSTSFQCKLHSSGKRWR